MTNVLAAVVLGLLAAMLFGRMGRDDSDPPGKRSGLIVYTDHKTGVQYVGTVFGALHVRVNASGKPVIANPTE